MAPVALDDPGDCSNAPPFKTCSQSLFIFFYQEYLENIRKATQSCKLLFDVPQGSVLGPLLFSLYTTPLSLIIGKHKGIKFHFYADGSQVYVHLSHKNASAAFEQLNRCLNDVK